MGNTPLWFHCPQARRHPVATGGYDPTRGGGFKAAYRTDPQRTHVVTRTGQARPNPSRTRSSRTLPQAHEFTCSCGHKGWTTHIDILTRPRCGEVAEAYEDQGT